jgi:hypothetical protein
VHFRSRPTEGDYTLETASKQKLIYLNNWTSNRAQELNIDEAEWESSSSEASTYQDDAATAGSTNFNFLYFAGSPQNYIEAF